MDCKQEAGYSAILILKRYLVGAVFKPSIIMVNQIRAVDKACLVKRMGHLQPEIIDQIERVSLP